MPNSVGVVAQQQSTKSNHVQPQKPQASLEVANLTPSSKPLQNRPNTRQPNVIKSAPDEIASAHISSPSVGASELHGSVNANRTIALTSQNDGHKVTKFDVAKTNNPDELIAFYESDTNAAEELGITTDEDGLYALKM